MSLPNDLQDAIEALTSGHSLSSLAEATQEVSGRYRSPDKLHKAPALTSERHRLSYLITRLPATYGAVHAVLTELIKRVPELAPKSLLDVGAGPGTGMWAAIDLFSSLEQITLVEQDPAFLALGQQLAKHATIPSIANAQWQQHNMTSASSWPVHDLVLLSYSIGEIGGDAMESVLKACWEAATQALVIVEPGTPRGYETILRARQLLAGWGGRLVAPCPQSGHCPMQGTKSWCHFSCRVSRSSAHRQIKGAVLGHEDEKYSYVVFTKDVGQPITERVVGHPLRKSGHVHVELCTLDGIKKTVISKRDPESYQWARKAEWGDGR